MATRLRAWLWLALKALGSTIALFGSICSIYAVIGHSLRSDFFGTWSTTHVTETFRFWVGHPILYVALAGSVGCWSGFFLFRGYQRAHGNVAIPPLLRRLNPFVGSRVCDLLHEFEHKWQDACRATLRLRHDKGIFTSEDMHEQVFKLLDCAKDIIDEATGADIAVHVKLFEHKGSSEPRKVKLEKALLKAYERKPSLRERCEASAGRLRPRENSETFRVLRGTKGLANNMVKNKETLQKARFRRCSAYNHVFTTAEHFYVCNDLKKATKAKQFFSTSNQYQEYYNSLCVFLLNRHLGRGQMVDPNPVLGVLVFDSHKEGVFDKPLMRKLGGYIAHRVYDLFSLVETTQKW